MNEQNKVHGSVAHLVGGITTTYPKIIQEYQSRSMKPIGYVDASVFSLAITEYCKNNGISIEEYLKQNSKEWHNYTYLMVLYAFIDYSITFKLNNITVLAGIADMVWQRALVRGEIPANVKFFREYINGWLILDSIDTEEMKTKHNQEWFRLALLALEHFKKAQKIALAYELYMPIQEAILDLQMEMIHKTLVRPEIKAGLPLSGVSTLAYNHNISFQSYRNALESTISYLQKIYNKKPDAKIESIVISPKDILGL